jgi:capsular exopolysaccharide synthesis family protein
VTNGLTFARRQFDIENRGLLNAERELAIFKQRYQIPDLLKQRDLTVAQAADATSSVHKAEVDIKGFEGQLAALIAARNAEPEFLTAPVTTTNNNISILKDRIASLKTDAKSLLVLYKPTHLKVQAIQAQIDDLEKQLAQAPAVVTTVTRSPNPARATYNQQTAQVQAALAARKAELARAQTVERLTSASMNRYSNLDRQQARLEREVDRRKTAVTLLASNIESLSIRQRTNRVPVKLISAASPAQQVAPQRVIILAAAILSGLLLGSCLVLLREHFDNHVYSREDVNRLLGSPVLGYIPMLDGGTTLLHPLDRAHDPATLDSYRLLRTNVLFATADIPKQSLMVTSNAPGEGKSMTAANLAIAMALDGKEVILVDADLRSPSLHRLFGLDQEPGLTDVLAGDANLAEALHETPVPGLRVLPAGATIAYPAELLNSQAMRMLHQVLKGEAQVVMFDSPPYSVADALVLSAATDGVVYVAEAKHLSKTSLQSAAELTRRANANLLGVVVNKISLASIDIPYLGYSGATSRNGPKNGHRNGHRNGHKNGHKNGYGSGHLEIVPIDNEKTRRQVWETQLRRPAGKTDETDSLNVIRQHPTGDPESAATEAAGPEADAPPSVGDGPHARRLWGGSLRNAAPSEESTFSFSDGTPPEDEPDRHDPVVAAEGVVPSEAKEPDASDAPGAAVK